MTVVRYELRSADELESLARAALPGGGAGVPKRTTHRDLYLDTPDDALRQRGIVCRLRVGSHGAHRLSLHLPGNGEAARVEAPVRGTSATSALAEESPVRRHLLSIVEPSALAVRLELEVERLTRAARRDLFGRARIELHLDRVTVRRDGAARTLYTLCAHHRRGPAVEFQRLVAELEREHALTADPSDPRERAALLQRWIRPTAPLDRFPSSEQPTPAARDAEQDPPEMLGAELSLLAFQRRVLALAEDPATPLRERLRFLGIVTSNLDEFFMVRMPELRQAAGARGERAHERADDGMTAGERLDRVEHEIASILAAQARCAETCLREAESHGTHVRRWGELTTDERALLRARCRDEIYPALTPLAMTLSPGHPLPHLPHLGLSLAVVFRSGAGSEAHLAELEIPHDVERLLAVPGRPGDVVPIEDVLRANVDLLYPNAKVDGAWLFRVTRAGDLELDERNADDLLAAVADATERRPYNPAVRVEVERTMPHSVCELVLDNLRREAAGRGAGEAVDCEPETVSGLLDLRCLAALPLPDDPALSYPHLAVRSPLGERPIAETLADGEILVHHPFDDYEGTVVRFLREAAADPQVTTIKITLYRVGEPSAVVDALLAAAERGKKVIALVELKARFDEEHNVSWARALEGAGAHVVYGFVGLKVHAKLALVVRREGTALRRYAHVSTGNYNTRSGRQYTDLSLFSAADPFTSDIADLFNALTGSSRPPEGLAHGALVAPVQLLPGVLERIERETRNARLGLPASIALKVNGLSDAEVVRALYRASQAGVRIELVVRGICTLRPGVAGRSEHVRVASVVGRFLEHSRIYRFENAGAPELFIGSSDLRPRNLRRRVELLVPVRDEANQRRLEALMRLYLDDHTAWQLRPDGCYERTSRDGPAAQAWLSSDGALTPSASRSAAPTG